MATIALYANKVNNMPSLLSGVNSSVRGLKTELGKIKLKSLAVSSQICDLEEVISTISAATQTQEDKAEALEDIHDKLIDFIDDVERIDDDVADEVEQSKDDFYNKYYYLKPECEKTGWEKFKDGCKKVVDWCKDNWQSLAKIVAAVVIIVALGVASVLTGGALAVILAGAFWGALIGGLAGGVIGGITSALTGGSFLDGFADGLLSGTISGAISGALTGGGQVLGKMVECVSKLGKVLKATSVVTNVLSTGMDGFDMLAMGIGLFDPNNALVKLNAKFHESAAYNIFQTGVGFVADFTGGAASTMKCFVAGTLVLTPAGLITIENIHPGDTVISTDPDTGEVAEKTVLETYVRETTELVHLTINGEVITSTLDHPFYVKDAGFVAAGELYIGDKLMDAQGNELVLEDMRFETTETPVKVYNFQVDEFHTYHVGESKTLVHNASDTYNALRKVSPSQEIRDSVNPEGRKFDPVYGYEVDRLEADHIVPLKEITEMPGFDELTFDQQVEIANLKENFMGLGKPTNASKGAKKMTEWKGHSKKGPIPDSVRDYLLERDGQAREAIGKAIAERLKNGNN